MQQAMFEKFGWVSPNVKPAVLCLFYKDLTGDCSASHDLPQSEVDNRVREMLSMEIEDPNTVVDLREVKNTESRTRFEHFWSEAMKYINEDLGVAVDDRRHGDVTHLAKAISIRDLREQVSLDALHVQQFQVRNGSGCNSGPKHQKPASLCSTLDDSMFVS